MRHTLIALLQDRPGTLNRAVNLFRRHGIGIESLSIAPGDAPGLSRLTAVAEVGDGAAVQRVARQLARLIEVLHVGGGSCDRVLVRETALVKVAVAAPGVEALLALATRYGARIVDVSGTAIFVEVTDAPPVVSEFLDHVRAFDGAVETSRSGRVALERGDPRGDSRGDSRPHTPRPDGGRTVPPSSARDVEAPDAPFTWQADGASDDAAA